MGPCTRFGEIGHEELHLLRPIVTPFLGEYDRDIAPRVERGRAHQHPVIASTPSRLPTRPTTVAALGQMAHQITHVFAMRQLPCPGHRTDVPPVPGLDQLQGCIGSKTSIRMHHHLPHPCRRLACREPMPKNEVLMPFALWSKGDKGKRETQAIPTGHHEHHVTAKRIGGMFVCTAHIASRVLTPTLLLTRFVPAQMEHPGGWWRKPAEDVTGHAGHERLLVPLA
jgi:hypothetical protein